MQFTRRAAILGGLSALPIIGKGSAAFAAQKLNVVATTGMIADAARRVGGERVEVRALMGPGVDPHAYRQTRSDIVAMTRADLVLWHGLYLEAQMEAFFEDLGRKRSVVAVAETIPKSILLGHADYDDRYDPHVWMYPALWTGVVRGIAQSLGESRPDDAEYFNGNASAYIAELENLHLYALKTLSRVPTDQRVLVTAHDAFGYFGKAYDFEVIGIQGISTASEAGLNRVSSLVNMLVEREINAVFVETSVSDRNIRALIEGAQARGQNVSIGGSLYSDAMGRDGTYEGTYLGMIDHNVTTIANALGADVDPAGMAGKLGQGS